VGTGLDGVAVAASGSAIRPAHPLRSGASRWKRFFKWILVSIEKTQHQLKTPFAGFIRVNYEEASGDEQNG
jgi:hypothetical protein